MDQDQSRPERNVGRCPTGVPADVTPAVDAFAIRLLAPWTSAEPEPEEVTDGGVATGLQPMVEILAVGHGRTRAANRLVSTAIGAQVRVVEVKEDTDERGWPARHVLAEARQSGLAIDCILSSPPGADVVRAQVQVTNTGLEPINLQSVTCLAVRVCLSGDSVTPTPADELDLLQGSSDWLGEGRWNRRGLRAAGLPELTLSAHGQGARGAISARSQGSWSTDGGLPVGGLIATSGAAWVWQIESSCGWRWEVGEDLAGVYLALSGPTDEDHQWQQQLAPGESFTTVPVALAAGRDLDAAVAALTDYRRAIRRDHVDNGSIPIIFNDYMNTLMGDPSTARLLPLISAAGAAGAAVFCIDAGWYSDDEDWWDSVGEWLPSSRRFPNGIGEVLDHIRENGMVPGLWLEPEVVGVRSPLAEQLPKAAFWQRGGTRVVEAGRYHLDLRHPAARAHLDATVDRLVNEFGVGYFKLDYNIRPGAGTDLGGDSPGAGLLAHTRAYYDWLDGVLDRHPDLILENCASGAMRMDYGLLSRTQLQSTSDQQDAVRYPAITVAAPLSILPEQCANWAYPQPGMPAEEAAATLVTGLAGRLYLSGHLDRMSSAELAVVQAATAAYGELREFLPTSHPRWPLGLPSWDDSWLALELIDQDGAESVLHLWHRNPGPNDVVLPIPRFRGHLLEVQTIFPTHLPEWDTDWDPITAELRVIAPGSAAFSARTLRLTTIRTENRDETR
ncbi:MAG TPA: glycoside hydrolase family 36 protein [Kineosporiaceae bacterium]|nr:glycoside hydrolase family 36 protein [Kineosporiaceae bacterium]